LERSETVNKFKSLDDNLMQNFAQEFLFSVFCFCNQKIYTFLVVRKLIQIMLAYINTTELTNGKVSSLASLLAEQSRLGFCCARLNCFPRQALVIVHPPAGCKALKSILVLLLWQKYLTKFAAC